MRDQLGVALHHRIRVGCARGLHAQDQWLPLGEGKQQLPRAHPLRHRHGVTTVAPLPCSTFATGLVQRDLVQVGRGDLQPQRVARIACNLRCAGAQPVHAAAVALVQGAMQRREGRVRHACHLFHREVAGGVLQQLHRVVNAQADAGCRGPEQRWTEDAQRHQPQGCREPTDETENRRAAELIMGHGESKYIAHSAFCTRL